MVHLPSIVDRVANLESVSRMLSVEHPSLLMVVAV